METFARASLSQAMLAQRRISTVPGRFYFSPNNKKFFSSEPPKKDSTNQDTTKSSSDAMTTFREQIHQDYTGGEPLKGNKKSGGAGKLVFVLFPIAAFALGTWQVDRLKWKEGIIHDRQEKVASPPVELPFFLNVEALKDLEYKRVKVTGEFIHSQEMHVGTRHLDGAHGVHVITPLKRSDGTVVLINRGWIPMDMRDQTKRAKDQVTGPVTVTGFVTRTPQKGPFTPDNQPEENRWHWVDLITMAKRVGGLPIMIELTESTRPVSLPVGNIYNPINIPNDHLNYAVTWYTLGMFLTGMTYYFFRLR